MIAIVAMLAIASSGIGINNIFPVTVGIAVDIVTVDRSCRNDC